MESYDEKGCMAPFFIEEDLKVEKEYMNVSFIRYFEETEIFILNRLEYEDRLKKVISEKCVHCIHYSEDICEEDYKSHIENIDLNGKCYGFEKKVD